MEEKLILPIQKTLKDLIDGNRDESIPCLMWKLNWQVSDLIERFNPDSTGFKTLDIIEAFNISFSYEVNEDFFLNVPSNKFQYNNKDIYYAKLGNFSISLNYFSNKYEGHLDTIRYLPDLSRNMLFGFAIGYSILYYNTNCQVFHNIYLDDLFYSSKLEKTISSFAMAFAIPISRIFKQLSNVRKCFLDDIRMYGNELISLSLTKPFPFLEDNPLHSIRIQEVRNLVADISAENPEIYEELKEKYPLLFRKY